MKSWLTVTRAEEIPGLRGNVYPCFLNRIYRAEKKAQAAGGYFGIVLEEEKGYNIEKKAGVVEERLFLKLSPWTENSGEGRKVVSRIKKCKKS